MSILVFLVAVTLILIWKVAEDLTTLHHEISIIALYFKEINDIYTDWVNYEISKDQGEHNRINKDQGDNAE